MKKLINTPETLIEDALYGMAIAYPNLSVDADRRLIVRSDAPVKGKVGLLSGGGSGHEPLHGGFVGRGMLDVACPGEVFTSPPPHQVLEGTKRVDGGAGVVHIIKNYTGDVLNFEMAAELARAEGIAIESVIIDDDVAVKDSLFTAGRRGVGATVLVEKIAGAAAEEGQDLAQVAEMCRAVNANARSMGVAFSSCTVPAAGRPTFELGENEMEVGIGIHGEPGRYRQEMVPASEIAKLLVEPILEDLQVASGESVLAFVNGMGATPMIELYVLLGEVAKLLEASGITIARNLVGPYVTALDMAGCSLTLLRLNDDFTRLWDAPVATPALTWGN